MSQRVESQTERLFKKRAVAGCDGECWIWSGTITAAGYGSLQASQSKRQYSHRISFLLHVGDIPTGMVVCHSCDNRACWNPSHLFLGTQADNLRDMTEKGRRSRCGPRGNANGRVRILDEQLPEILSASGSGVTTRQLADLYGVHHCTIARILRGDRNA